MNSKQPKVLAAIYAEPAPSGLAWKEIENLLVAAGCRLVEGSGSRVKFVAGTFVASFHRPHPAKEAKQYQVRDARRLLEHMGVRP